MIQFTRHRITCGLEIGREHVSDETLTLSSKYGDFTIGTEYYSLVICPDFDTDNPWRIEGLRGSDKNEIWFTGTMNACISEFERITQEIRDAGHQINEPENYNLAKEVREVQYHKHILPRSPWNLGE